MFGPLVHALDLRFVAFDMCMVLHRKSNELNCTLI